ncbi:MAG TPA: hypothetical protein DCY61_01870, partial [Dehalococcoidia bacterium]|nr:hypothetical protein [Dehalococcoidia bacterium]
LPFLCIFETLHIPDAVWSETVEQGRTPQADVLRLNNVQRHTLFQSEVTSQRKTAWKTCMLGSVNAYIFAGR